MCVKAGKNGAATATHTPVRQVRHAPPLLRRRKDVEALDVDDEVHAAVRDELNPDRWHGIVWMD